SRHRNGPLNVLQGFASREGFDEWVREFAPGGRRRIDSSLAGRFNDAIDLHDRNVAAQGRPGLRDRFDDLCHRMARQRDYHPLPDRDREDRRALIRNLRAELAASCIEALEPDLVILDEFQRFKYLLHDEEDPAAQLARELFTWQDEEAGAHARVLLLSATP